MSFTFGLFQADTFGAIGDPDLGSLNNFPFFRASIDIVFTTLFNIYILNFFITPTNLAKEREREKLLIEGTFIFKFFPEKSRKKLQMRPRKDPQTKGNACALHEMRQQG